MNDKKVLIIDDEFPVRYLVEHQLRRHGFEAFTAKDGPSGIQAAQQHRPDLIVLDIMMPRMNGFEVCQEIRRDPAIGATPVIFLTACMTRKHKLRAFEMGADDYLVKPFQPDELLAHITAVLRRSKNGNGKEEEKKPRGRVVSLFSPKGGVGTTTLAVQLSEAVVLREGKPVVLIDLDLPLGGVAPMMGLYTNRHTFDLLSQPTETITIDSLHNYTQRHRANLLVIPTPTELIRQDQKPTAAALQRVLHLFADNGYQVILDLGSTLSHLTLEALRSSDLVYVVTSGQSVANKLHDAFLNSAPKLGLDSNRLLPVINELHGSVDQTELSRVPVARIPHASDRSRTRLWLRDQGMHKLVSVMA